LFRNNYVHLELTDEEDGNDELKHGYNTSAKYCFPYLRETVGVDTLIRIDGYAVIPSAEKDKEQSCSVHFHLLVRRPSMCSYGVGKSEKFFICMKFEIRLPLLCNLDKFFINEECLLSPKSIVDVFESKKNK
jgi:hypothetical protein